MKKIPEEVQVLLKSVFDVCQQEDVAVRERQIRTWRRLKLLWEGYNRVWYSETAHDWRIWDEEAADENTDQAYYDKPVNVFKAYLESICAALSVVVPPVKCYPDDADNMLDQATARAGDKIAQLIYRHNDASQLWLHALFTFMTEGMVACYSYSKSDVEYGTYTKKDYADVTEEHEQQICPNCGNVMSSKLINTNDPNAQQDEQAKQVAGNERSEFDPGDDDIELHNLLNEGEDLCLQCMQMVDPELQKNSFVVTRLVGETTEPKTRIHLEVLGGLWVKVANYARCQKDTPYLIYSHEEDYAMTVDKYEDLQGNKELAKMIKGGNAGGYEQYEQWGRLSPQYQGEYPMNVVTVSEAWIRPAKFHVLNDDKNVKLLKKYFPDGAKCVCVNGIYAYACNESLDDHWTLTYNPMSNYVYFDPTGQGLVPLQEITNDLVSLILQTIEHGIGQTFADPAVLNFNSYEQMETLPGGVYPAVAKSGRGLSDGFFELKTATLSQETMPFFQQVQSLAQLVSGALPSIFGGQIEGSDTASEYSMSRAQALQRLQNVWKMQTIWWKTIFGKAIPQYIKTVEEDEHDVQRDDDGNFINVMIKRAELEGKIGRVELEANENLPMTWSQRKDLLMNLLQASNPEVIKIISAPENISLIHDALGLVDFYSPGEDDVTKQYDEIKELLNSTPIPTANPQEPETASVPIDPIYDNHQIEFEICRKWAISEAGRQIKVDNPEGYQNVLLHGKLHFMQIQQAMAAQQQQQEMPDKKPSDGKGAVPNRRPNQKLQEAPIMGDGNVSTVQ